MVRHSIVLSLVIMILVMANAPGVRAQCVTVALIDEGGQVVKPDGLVTGVLVGDDPVFVTALPEHRERRVVGSVACTPEIIGPVVQLYNLSCRNEQAMRQATVNNDTTFEVVRERCQDLARAVAAAQ